MQQTTGFLYGNVIRVQRRNFMILADFFDITKADPGRQLSSSIIQLQAQKQERKYYGNA
jgi:hypothetical protein